jgi:hypothetical protein
VTVHSLPGRGLYVFTYDEEIDTLTTSQPGDLERVTRWERYVKGTWFRPYPPEGLPDLEVGVSDTTREVQEEYGDPPKVEPDILQHALRLHNASRYHIWGFEETVALTSTHRRLDLTTFNVLRHGLDALKAAGFAKPRLAAKPDKSVEIAECIWCDCVTINPESETCACGEEFSPTTKRVPPGTRIKGELLRS